MKKTFKTILLLSTLTFTNVLFSCSGNNNNSQNVSETVSSIDIAGATSVLKGKTIQLVASVDDVIWSTSDEYIASVDENGLVTGVEAGVVTIRATYKYDNTIYDEIDVTVYLYKASSINAEIKGDEVKLNEDNTYNVPLGKVFDVYVNVDAGFSIPSFSYEIQYPTGSDVDNVITLTPDAENPNHATLIAYYDIKGVTLICKGIYQDLSTAPLIKSLVFNVIDKNEENNKNVNNFISSFKEEEKNSLVSYKSNQSLKYIDSNSNINSYENIVESTYKQYLNSSYVTSINTYLDGNGNVIYKDFDNDGILDEDTFYYTSNNYQGIATNNEKSTYYSFDYNNDGVITNLYYNEAVSMMNIDNVNYAMNPNNSNVFGISGLLDAILNSTENIYNNVISLGNIYAYANSEFNISSDKIVINSIFKDIDTDINYDITLEVSLNNERISNIKYKQTISSEIADQNSEASSLYTYTFVEEYYDFVYDTKVNDSPSNEKYLNIADYYMTSYDLVELAGTETDVYNYTDLTKYGSNAISEENGIIKYILTTDKTLVLKVDNIVPNKASTLIDRVVATSSDTDQIPNVTLTGSDVFSINAKKDDNSISQPGKATFTFKSTNGIEKQIIVEFVKAELKAVFTSNVPTGNDFGKVFKNDLSSYFFINTNPDEDLYSFGIEIIEGPENGIELYEYENGNLDGIPGFAYSIKGLIIGTYSFKIYVKENPDIKTKDTYKITIDEAYDANYIKDNLIDTTISYRYSTGLVEYDIQFTSETVITYTYKAYGEEISKNINYHIEDGSVIIDEDQYLGTNVYYSWIRGGNIKFARDFSSITLYLEAYYENTNEEIKDLRHYYPVTFDRVVDKSDLVSYLDGKSFTSEVFIYGGIGMTDTTLSFNNNIGTLTISPKNNNSNVTITFNYSYNSSTCELTLSNISSSNSSYSLNNKGEFNIYTDVLNLNVKYGNETTLIEFNI